MSSRKRDEPNIDVALPVVPMLDMSFQILFFFIITFNPNPSEGQMTMNLPASGKVASKDQSNLSMTDNSDIELEVPSDFVVVVKSYESNLTVSVRQGDKPNPDNIGAVNDLDKMQPTERTEAVNALMEKLSQSMAQKLADKRAENPSAAKNVKIEANSTMKYGLLVGVMDACIRAGYEQVGFVAPPDLGQ